MSQSFSSTEVSLEDTITAVRAYVSKRMVETAVVEDITQSTIEAVWSRESYLRSEVKVAYAVVVARHLIADHYRQAATAERLLSRVIDGEQRVGDRIADDLLLAEEHEALRTALTRIPDDEAKLLRAHHVDDTSLQDLSGGSSRGSVAVKLARARARLRLEYLLAFRKQGLATPQCRSVLLSLSAGDLRRQLALGSGAHLLECESCAVLAPPLLERKRGLAALGPVGVIAEFAKANPIATSVATASTGAACAAVVVFSNPTPVAAPPDPCAEVVVVDGRSLPSVPSSSVTDGAPVTVRNAQVVGELADEGFWLGCGSSRLWVQMNSRSESPVTIMAGQYVSFAGVVTHHGASYASAVGVVSSADATALTSAGYHVDTAPSEVSIGR